MTRCAAILNIQWRNQQPWVKCCENRAVMKCDGVPLCGTHVNHPLEQVVAEFGPYDTVEKL